MRESLFRTLVAYLRSPGAPHRLRMVPLLTLLVRSHAEFEENPPPLVELSGLLAAVLRECDKATCGRGPGSAVWRAGDCPGGLQLETRWANAGLLLLMDLATETRRAQDSLKQRPMKQISKPRAEEEGLVDVRPSGIEPVSGSNWKMRDVGHRPPDAEKQGANNNVSAVGAIRVSVPVFGTRLDECPPEEGGEEVAEEAERSLADCILVGGRSLLEGDKALLQADLRNSLLPDADSFALQGDGISSPINPQEEEAASGPPSRCLHHLLEIMDTLQALRDGWPTPPVVNSALEFLPKSAEQSLPVTHGPLYLDSLLCEAWMDAVGPASVVESDHPFRKGTLTETLHFPGAEEILVFIDPRSSMQQVRIKRFVMLVARMLLIFAGTV